MQQRIDSSLDTTVNGFLDRNFKPSVEQIAELDDHAIENALQAEGYFGIPKELWLKMVLEFQNRHSALLHADGNGSKSVEAACMIFFACGWLARASHSRKDGHGIRETP